MPGLQQRVSLLANQKASAALLANQRQGQIVSKPLHQSSAYQLHDSKVYRQQAQVKGHGSLTTWVQGVTGQRLSQPSKWIPSHASSAKEQGLSLLSVLKFLLLALLWYQPCGMFDCCSFIACVKLQLFCVKLEVFLAALWLFCVKHWLLCVKLWLLSAEL